MNATLKAIFLMAVFSGAVALVMNLLGLHEKFSEPLFALAGAIILLLALISNVTIFLKVAGETPFKWFKE